VRSPCLLIFNYAPKIFYLLTGRGDDKKLTKLTTIATKPGDVTTAFYSGDGNANQGKGAGPVVPKTDENADNYSSQSHTPPAVIRTDSMSGEYVEQAGMPRNLAVSEAKEQAARSEGEMSGGGGGVGDSLHPKSGAQQRRGRTSLTIRSHRSASAFSPSPRSCSPRTQTAMPHTSGAVELHIIPDQPASAPPASKSAADARPAPVAGTGTGAGTVIGFRHSHPAIVTPKKPRSISVDQGNRDEKKKEDTRSRHKHEDSDACELEPLHRIPDTGAGPSSESATGSGNGNEIANQL